MNKFFSIHDILGIKNEQTNIHLDKIEGLEKESEVVTVFLSCHTARYELKFYHTQDYCGCVTLNDFEDDIVKFRYDRKSYQWNTLVTGLDVSEREASDDEITDCCGDWTFYRLKTTNGDLFMRWLGESNGYYSFSVDMEVAIKSDFDFDQMASNE